MSLSSSTVSSDHQTFAYIQGIALHDQYKESNQVEGAEVSLDTLDLFLDEPVRLAGWAESTTLNVVDLYLL